VAKSVVLTGAGRDRVGIVAELAEMLFDMGCNLLDSSMTLLRGEFAIILMIRLPENISVDNLKVRIGQIETKLGLTIHIRELSDQELDHSAEDQGPSYIVSVYGADRPGIVSGVTKALANLSVNITDVATQFSGDINSESKNVFVMILEATAPANVTEETLRKRLLEVSTALKVDISLQAIDVVEL
jgi:glycine cleavage system transcriptional repressor